MDFSGLDRQTDFYHALECEILAQCNALSPVLAASGFLPLICGAASIYGWTATLYNDLVLQQAGIKRV